MCCFDIVEKFIGIVDYGIDFIMLDMVFVIVCINLWFGGGFKLFDVVKVEDMCGVIKVVEIDGGIGVIVDNMWCVFKVVDVIDYDWVNVFYLVMFEV